MNAKEVGETILGMKVETPITKEFDDKYGQRKDRWWDNIETDGEKCCKQKYHWAVHFLCHYYYGGPSNCPYSFNCKGCYQNGFEKLKPYNDSKAPSNIYNSKQPPEMFLWLYEALSLKTEDELKDLCKKYEDNRRFSPEDKIEWEVIEEELEKKNKG